MESAYDPRSSVFVSQRRNLVLCSIHAKFKASRRSKARSTEHAALQTCTNSHLKAKTVLTRLAMTLELKPWMQRNLQEFVTGLTVRVAEDEDSVAKGHD